MRQSLDNNNNKSELGGTYRIRHIDHRNLTFPVWMEARASTSLLFSSALLQTWRPQLPALLDVRSQRAFSVSNESHIDVRGLVLACGPIGRRDLCQGGASASVRDSCV